MENPLTCPTCHKPYGKRKRCYWCSPPNPRNRILTACAVCGAEVSAQPNQLARGEGMYCSKTCKYNAMRGRELVKGSKFTRKDGYVTIKTGIAQREMEHRVVVARAIGRSLTSDEQVHHINGVRDDNRLENLQLMTNAEHQKLHDHLGVNHAPRTVTLVCVVCANEYQTKPSRALSSTCCSDACRLVHMRASRTYHKK